MTEPEVPAQGGSEPESAQPQENAPEAGDSLADLKAENASLADELARANAAYYNLSQEYTNYVRRSKEQAGVARSEGVERVASVLLGVLDDVELARQHGGLEGPLGSMAERLEQALATNFSLVRFGAAGEEFDPSLHEAILDIPSPEVTDPTIAQVIQPGYLLDGKVIRAAQVAVNSPA